MITKDIFGITSDGRTVTLALPGYCAAMVVVQGAP